MIPMGMVQVPVDQVIDVITVGYGWMPAARAMNVILVVSLTFVVNAPRGIGIRDRNYMLVVVILMGAVQVPVVQVSHVVPVPHGDVTAVRAVLVGVILMDSVGHGSNLPTSNVNGCGRVGMIENIPDECFHVSVRQPVEHVPSIAPARD